ncbi:glycosyltransferase [Paenibacillus senegalensis]|uniref:glycosyltransferase n=1 Tax=Paenibacillus senegalensis TaxID=1465766 RepID=UPI0002882E17|nr:glycosyltransferase [Paenibacillus senegalensis]
MDKLKILFMTRDDRKYTVPASYYFVNELARISDLQVSHSSGRIMDIIESINVTPDFVYFNDYLENGSPVVTGLKDLPVPFAVGLHDLHYNYPGRKQVLHDEEVRYVFTHYRDRFLKWYPEFSKQMRWLPHHANTDIFTDYDLHKETDLLMTGALIEPYYPLRTTIVKRLAERPEFMHLPHPGYRQIDDQDVTAKVGKKYAMELNKAKICFTCNSIYHYPVMKYFEIAACNSLLMAPYSPEIGDLGFIPGVNFVAIDEHNFEEKAYYYLRHEEERSLIALNGMNMIRQKHSTRKRAAEFLESIKQIIRDSKEAGQHE